MRPPASLHLSFEAKPSGETILRVKQQQPPWRVVRGFRVPSGETLAHIHNLSGGILDTDALALRIDVREGAQAQVTSIGATRIYRSRSLAHVASQTASVEVGEAAHLEYLPDQVIPYADSRFEQTARVRLREGASLIWCERAAPGREASGEVFRYQSFASTFELVALEEPVALERWTLTPLRRRLDSVSRLGRFQHFATCYVCRAGQPAGYWKSFECRMQQAADQASHAELLWGVTCLRAHGLVLRGVSTSGRLLADGLAELWKAAKWQLCGRAATIPRKVH